MTRDRREGEAQPARARIPGDRHRRLRGRGSASAARPDAPADRGRGARRRRRPVPDRRARGTDPARRGNRPLAARRRHAGDRRRQQGRRPRRRERAGSRPIASASASRSRSAPSMARASSTCSRRCGRMSSARTVDEDEAEDERRRAAQAGDRRAAQRRQVDPGQPMLGEERMITGPEAGITRDSISLDWEWEGRAGAAGRHRGPAQARQGRRQARAVVRRRHPPRDRLCRSRRAAARRDPRPRSRRTCKIAAQVIEEGRALVIALNKWDVAEHASSLFNGVKAALDEGLAQLQGRAAADRVGARPARASTRCSRSRSSCAKRGAGASRPASSTAGSSGRSRPIRRPRPGGKRIKLRYITQVKTPPAELRRVRQPHRRASRKLSALSAQCDAPRPRAWPGAAAPRLPRPHESVRHATAAKARKEFYPFRPIAGCGGTTPDASGA